MLDRAAVERRLPSSPPTHPVCLPATLTPSHGVCSSEAWLRLPRHSRFSVSPTTSPLPCAVCFIMDAWWLSMRYFLCVSNHVSVLVVSARNGGRANICTTGGRQNAGARRVSARVAHCGRRAAPCRGSCWPPPPSAPRVLSFKLPLLQGTYSGPMCMRATVRVQERTGDLASTQRLVYAGYQLAHERCIADYEVTPAAYRGNRTMLPHHSAACPAAR